MSHNHSNNNNNNRNNHPSQLIVPTIAAVPPTFEAQNRRSNSPTTRPPPPAAATTTPIQQQQQQWWLNTNSDNNSIIEDGSETTETTLNIGDNLFFTQPQQLFMNNGSLNEPTALALWRERERRQRTIRVFMMFLLMLLLMEEEPNSSSVRHPNNHHPNNGKLRGSIINNNINNSNNYDKTRRRFNGTGHQYPYSNNNNNHNNNNKLPLSLEVYTSRVIQDEKLRQLGQLHPRYHHLIQRQSDDLYKKQHNNNNNNVASSYNTNNNGMKSSIAGQQQQQQQQNQRTATSSSSTATTTTSSSTTSDGNNRLLLHDYNEEIVQWAISISDMEQDEFDKNDNSGNTKEGSNSITSSSSSTITSSSSNSNAYIEKEIQDDTKVLHYPWNSTGFYRGDWKRIDTKSNNYHTNIQLQQEQQQQQQQRRLVEGEEEQEDFINEDIINEEGEIAIRDYSERSDQDNDKNSKGSFHSPKTNTIQQQDNYDTEAVQQQQGSDNISYEEGTIVTTKARKLISNNNLIVTTDPSSSTISDSNTMKSTTTTTITAAAAVPLSSTTNNNYKTTTVKSSSSIKKTALELEQPMLHILQHEKYELFGVHILPEGYMIQTRDDHNLTSIHWEELRIDQNGRWIAPPSSTGTGGNNNNKKLPFIVSGGVDSDGSSTTQKDVNDNNNNDHNINGKTTATTTIGLPPATLTRDNGRAAFQLFSRSIPAMKELSLVDGFIKLYDSTSPGYSTSKDILLRVRGVLIHSIGRLSLTANADVSRAAFVMSTANTNRGSSISTPPIKSRIVMTALDTEKEKKQERRRRLQEAIKDLANANINEIRTDVIELYGSNNDHAITPEDTPSGMKYDWSLITPDFETMNHESITADDMIDSINPEDTEYVQTRTKRSRKLESINLLVETSTTLSEETITNTSKRVESTLSSGTPGDGERDKESIDETTTTKKYLPPWSDYVMPYPYVRDDNAESIRIARTPAARLMPSREQSLEANAAHCSFEINMDVEPVEWTLGAWRKLVSRHVEQTKLLNPDRYDDDENEDGDEEDGTETDKKDSINESKSAHQQQHRTAANGGKRRNFMENSYILSSSSHSSSSRKAIEDQALVMSMIGDIRSPNCDFAAILNVTALRTDWEATTNKAINYSFYMMLVCLTQILILLRQLLHSQSNATATRVSILCIGWQTVIDALLCLAHIYLSLAVQPLFTAFASIAFFKLLIFCVIEMKYMAIITQARNSSNGGQPTEVLRRQVAMLHVRFYVALMIVFVMMSYVTDKYRLPFILALYSFWVPQIVLNIVTEAKAPMHKYYIYGMSLTRLVVPLYMLALPGNFLKQVYPDTPSDVFTCEMLVLWIALQTAILMGQSKYGARFMIPTRFLPPKFDYSRPIPASMLPPGASAAILLFDQQQQSRSSTAAAISAESMIHRNDLYDAKKTPSLSILSATSSSSSSPPALIPSVDESVARSRHNTTAVTTRNRIRGNRLAQQGGNGVMTTEDYTITSGLLDVSSTGTTSSTGRMTTIPLTSDIPHSPGSLSGSSSGVTLPPPPSCIMECSICYDGIDIRKRKDYMLAPCNHLFHRECLSQWMDVKMECPICRTELPAF